MAGMKKKKCPVHEAVLEIENRLLNVRGSTGRPTSLHTLAADAARLHPVVIRFLECET